MIRPDVLINSKIQKLPCFFRSNWVWTEIALHDASRNISPDNSRCVELYLIVMFKKTFHKKSAFGSLAYQRPRNASWQRWDRRPEPQKECRMEMGTRTGDPYRTTVPITLPSSLPAPAPPMPCAAGSSYETF